MAEVLPRRIGFYSLRKTALAMCKYTIAFTPIIKKFFPDAVALHAALAAANAACALVIAEIDLVAEPGV